MPQGIDTLIAIIGLIVSVIGLFVALNPSITQDEKKRKQMIGAFILLTGVAIDIVDLSVWHNTAISSVVLIVLIIPGIGTVFSKS